MRNDNIGVRYPMRHMLHEVVIAVGKNEEDIAGFASDGIRKITSIDTGMVRHGEEAVARDEGKSGGSALA